MSKRRFARGQLAAVVSVFAFGLAATAVSNSASAADWGSAAAPGWSGGYVGIHAGGAWGRASVLDNIADGVDPGPFGYSASGAFGGGTAGLNWQMGGIVSGIEGDLGYLNLTGAGVVPSSDPMFHQDITVRGGLYGDLTGRLGFAVGNTLLYGKGGFAFYNGQANQVTTKPGYSPTGTGTFTGWAVGAGIEQHVGSNMSWKVEYLHFDFGTQAGYQTNIGDMSSPPLYQFYNWTTLHADTIKVGLNWQFAGPHG